MIGSSNKFKQKIICKNFPVYCSSFYRFAFTQVDRNYSFKKFKQIKNKFIYIDQQYLH